MNASVMPWWGWLLCALFFWAAGVFGGWQYEGESYKASPSERSLAWLKITWYALWIIGGFCLLVGIVRLVKWAWQG
jgi:hypothetical protein